MTEEQTLQKRFKALTAKLRELHSQQDDILREMQTIADGGVSVADKVKRVETFFQAEWESVYGGAYAWRYSVDVPNIKRLLRSIDVEELLRRIENFFGNREDFYRKGRHTFGMFVATVNTHASYGADTDANAFDLEPPPDCKHKPPCKTDQQHTKKRAAEMAG